MRDLGSSNGTALNGEPIQQAEVKDGDILRFGPVAATFVAEDPVATPSVESEPRSDESDGVGFAAEALNDLSGKLANLARRLWGETQRVAQVAALKAKIIKLKTIDLNAAHYALGKRCYELGFHKEQFAREFESISAVKGQIEENSKAIRTPQDETTGSKIKRLGAKALAETMAPTLQLRLKHKICTLGKQCAAQNRQPSEATRETAAVYSLLHAITSLADQYNALGAFHGNFSAITDAAQSITNGAITALLRFVTVARVRSGPLFKFVRHRPQASLYILVALIVSLSLSVRHFKAAGDKLLKGEVIDDLKLIDTTGGIAHSTEFPTALRQAALMDSARLAAVAKKGSECEWLSFVSHGVLRGPSMCRVAMELDYQDNAFKLTLSRSLRLTSPMEVDLLWGDPPGTHIGIPFGREWHTSRSSTLTLDANDLVGLQEVMNKYQNVPDSHSRGEMGEMIGNLGGGRLFVDFKEGIKVLNITAAASSSVGPLIETLEPREVELMLEIFTVFLREVTTGH